LNPTVFRYIIPFDLFRHFLSCRGRRVCVCGQTQHKMRTSYLILLTSWNRWRGERESRSRSRPKNRIRSAGLFEFVCEKWRSPSEETEREKKIHKKATH
jgi:hypothetical protein